MYYGHTANRRIIAGRHYFRFATLPASGTPSLISFQNASGSGNIRINSSGQVTCAMGAGSTQNVGSPTTTGVWYRLDYLINTSGGTASLKVRLDGGTEAESTNVQAAADVTDVRVGHVASATTDMFVDDFILGDDVADYPFGEGTVEGLVPTSDGTHSFTAGDFGYNAAGANVSTSATDVNTYLDESDATSVADFIRQKVIRTAGYVEVDGFTPSSSAAPQAVAVVLSMHSAGTGANTMGWKLNDNGTVVAINDAGGDGLTDISNTGVANIYKVFATKPSTSTAWTNSALTGLAVRGGYSGDVNAEPYWDGVLLEVAFPPASGSYNQTPAGANIVITGQVPVLGFTLAPTNASIAVTGQTPAVVLGTRLSPTAASVAVTGQTPTLIFGTVLSPTAASVSVTGQTPTIAVSDHKVLSPAAATVAVTGQTPVLDLLLAPSGASVAVTGQVPSVAVTDHKTVDPAAASIAVTGQTPTVEATDHQTLAPAAASIAVTGQTPTVTASDHKTVAPDAAAIAVTGQTPTIEATDHKTLSPAAATITITGIAPVVTTGDNVAVSPAAAAVAVTGQTPTIDLTDHKVLAPTAASIAISSFAPTIVLTDNKVVAPTPAAIAITAMAPDVVLTDHKTLFPAAAAVAVTGGTPSVLVLSPLPWQVDVLPVQFGRANIHFERD